MEMNPNIIIAPVYGIGGRSFFPPTFSKYGTERLIDFMFYRDKTIYNINSKINSIMESRLRRVEIGELNKLLKENDMNLYVDCTPLGYLNQDISILNWYVNRGKCLNFDFLIFNKYDLYIKGLINDVYGKYTKFDAAFNRYEKIHNESQWSWVRLPFTGKNSVKNWLKRKKLNPTLFKGFFPGFIISKKVLEKISKIELPFGYCELRLPSVITGLGFSCSCLDFPMVQLNKKWDISEIKKESKIGIYHPVYNDLQ
jgi:hypothetical protein